jgi:hypothetical protein
MADRERDEGWYRIRFSGPPEIGLPVRRSLGIVTLSVNGRDR